MNRVIQELSRQMSNHLDAQRNGTVLGHPGSPSAQARYRKQLADVQSELKTERSLHEITKTSLQALEEDCQRLRHQLIVLRRREPHPTEKYVSRLFLTKIAVFILFVDLLLLKCNI